MNVKSVSAAPEKNPHLNKPDAPHSRLSQPEVIFVLAVCLLLGVRLYILISNHAVNILYWDQWDFFEPLFDGRQWWELFRWQHGPWRQGIGFISYLIADLTHWNSRSEAFFIGGLVFLAMIAALWLKLRLFGRLAAYDIAIPLIVLTTAQFQTFAGPVNSAPTAFPTLLLTLYCLAWTAQREAARYALVLIFNFLLVNTGYGLFTGAITIALLSIECWKRRAAKLSFTGSLVALAASLLTIVWFVSDYDLDHFNNSIGRRSARFWEYPLFAALMFGRFVRPEVGRIGWPTYLAMICGVALLILAVAALILHSRRIIRAEFPDARISLTIVILLGFGLLFAMNTAFGRAGMGLNVSQSSRFVTLMIPAFLGLYFHLLALAPSKLRRFTLAFFLLLLPGHLPLSLGANHPASYFSRNKRQWKDCYLRTGDFQKCEEMSDFKLLPAHPPEVTKSRLDYLKQHRLNLFADDR